MGRNRIGMEGYWKQACRYLDAQDRQLSLLPPPEQETEWDQIWRKPLSETNPEFNEIA